jgi:stage II sporulation protein D
MRNKLNALLNIAIAALSVTAVFAVFTSLEFETAEESPFPLETTLVVISEPDIIPETVQTSETIETTTAATTAPPVTIATTRPLAASVETSTAYITSEPVIEDVVTTSASTNPPETTAKTTAKTTIPSVKTTAATTTKKKPPEDLLLYEETEPPENQLIEEFEEEQSLIVITMPATTTTAATTPATSFITGYTDPPVTSAAATSTAAPTVPVPVSDNISARVNGSSGSYNTFDLVCGIVQNEVGSSFDDEAIKAQAVAAYTYLKYYEQNGTTASVSANFNYTDKVKNNVAAVFGQAVYYNGKYAQTVYSASSGGYTASAQNVWGGAIAYLVSVPAPHDVASDPNYGIKKTISASDVKNAIERNLGITLSENPANWVSVASRVDGIYVDDVLIDGQRTISGADFRADVMSYDIRSAAFDVYFDGQNFIFTTYGYGHGVGMSQHGANILAKQGYSYIDILKFYYTGVEIK